MSHGGAIMCSFSFFKKNNKVSNSNKVNNLVNVDYLINDPSTPSVVEQITNIPVTSSLKYRVHGLTTAPKNKNQKRALNCHVTITNSINAIQKQSSKPIKKWAGTRELEIWPQASKQLNAFYNRKSLQFCYYPHGGMTLFTSDSADIVTHELGHAILDAIRPDFWHTPSLEISSFHEAFSDICSIFSILQYDSVIRSVLKTTENDIYNSNLASRLAEELGILVHKKLGGNQTGSLAKSLRDPAIELFKYKDPKKLPAKGRDNQLLSECHSFGRVFSAAWYQILIKIYKIELKNNHPFDALKNARDISFSILIKSIPSSAKNINYFNSIARSMINYSSHRRYVKYQNALIETFKDWKIIDQSKPELKMLSNISWKDVVVNLKKEDSVVKNKDKTIVCLKDSKSIKINQISSMSNNNSISALNNVEIEVPNDTYYEFDKKGNLVDEIEFSEKEITLDTIMSLENIDLNEMWKVENNKLNRNFIS